MHNRYLGYVVNGTVGWEQQEQGYYIYTMNMNGIEYNLIWCHKCGHEWLSKLDCPKMCPKCKRYNPWEEKGQRITSGKKSTNKRRWPIQHLQVGEHTVLQWVHLPNGQPDTRAGDSMNRCIRQEEQHKGKKFEKYPTSAGLFVRRIS